MNFPIDDVITDAIAMANPADWKDFFDAMRMERYEMLRTCETPESLTQLRAHVTLIDELEQFVVSARQNPKSTK
jgi:hypothetical protein